jgi:hypothetical protein
VVALLFGGCAATPSVGVRRDYHQHTLRRVAVAPLTASSHFGLEDSEWHTIRATYERQVLTELSSFGFHVVPAGELERRLRASGHWQTFTEVLVPRGGLEARFEPQLQTDETSLEVDALRALAADSALEADALLMTEIVYQSDGFCDQDPREHSPHAVVVGDIDKSSPCVVSHFQAKLVDPTTGRTMWHNRQLLERRVDQLDDRTKVQNIREVVAATISGPHGLGPLASPEFPR